MLSANDARVAEEFKSQVRDLTHVLAMYVYGSRARGDATSDSDLDVFLELEDVSPALRLRISEIAWEVGFARDMVISTFVVSRDQLENGAIGANPIIGSVMREGIPV